MTFKEIWKAFGEKVKVNASNSWASIRKVAKSTFDLLKVTLIDFIGGFFKWLWDLTVGVLTIVKDFVLTLGQALATAIESTFVLGYKKLVEWINKW